MKIDYKAIDTEQFSVREQGGRILIAPRKDKHIWLEEELHLRSLLLDTEGNVLSAGYPKFRNWGENAVEDSRCAAAFARGAVELSDKLDGSCILLDWIDGQPHFRTRGSFDLGDFERPVMDLIRMKYPKLLDWYVNDPSIWASLARRCLTLLFEYVGPDNQIVLKYSEPALYLTGYVEKSDLTVGWDKITMQYVSDATLVPQAPILAENWMGSAETVAKVVSNWTDCEGVVIRYVSSDDLGIDTKPKLMKMKTDEYFRLHALKFRLEGKVGKLCYLLGVEDADEGREALLKLGIDFETATFVIPEMNAYLSRFYAVEAVWRTLDWRVSDLRVEIDYDLSGEVPGDKRDRAHRKLFVERIREWLEHEEDKATWFSVAMLMYNDKAAWTKAVADLVLHEPVQVVEGWRKNRSAAVDSMLNLPIGETD